MAERAGDDGPRIAALVLNWRQPELTAVCLADLLAATTPLHVLVVDNGSGADVARDLERRVAAAAVPSRHRVTFLALPDNLGFTGGMNRGIAWAQQAGCEFVLVLNNDLRLPPDFVAPLVATLQNDPRVAAVGPTVLHPDGTVWAEGGRRGFCANGLVLIGHGGSPRPRTHGPEAVPFLPGACVLFRTADLAAVGGFDDRYFMYWEDVDLCDRLRAHGGEIVWLPWVQVVHASGASSGGGRSPLRKFLMACNSVRYLRQHGGLRGWLAFALFDLLLWPVILPAGPRAALAKLRGMWAGLCGHRAGAADVARYLAPR